MTTVVIHATWHNSVTIDLEDGDAITNDMATWPEYVLEQVSPDFAELVDWDVK